MSLYDGYDESASSLLRDRFEEYQALMFRLWLQGLIRLAKANGNTLGFLS